MKDDISTEQILFLDWFKWPVVEVIIRCIPWLNRDYP